MKKLTVQQHLNPKFYGDSTPDEPKHLYKVVQVTDSVLPVIHATLTPQKLDDYCEAESWTVTIK